MTTLMMSAKAVARTGAFVALGAALSLLLALGGMAGTHRGAGGRESAAGTASLDRAVLPPAVSTPSAAPATSLPSTVAVVVVGSEQDAETIRLELAGAAPLLSSSGHADPVTLFIVLPQLASAASLAAGGSLPATLVDLR